LLETFVARVGDVYNADCCPDRHLPRELPPATELLAAVFTEQFGCTPEAFQRATWHAHECVGLEAEDWDEADDEGTGS
jgi:hypothetical protein